MFPQVRFWTMRVATEIGEKRVAHSQAKEQEGMVPLKVDNEADHWNQIMIIIIMVIIPFLPISDLTVMSFWSKEIIVLKIHLFSCVLWPLAMPSSECAANFPENFARGDIQIGKSDQTRPK